MEETNSTSDEEPVDNMHDDKLNQAWKRGGLEISLEMLFINRIMTTCFATVVVRCVADVKLANLLVWALKALVYCLAQVHA